MIVLKALGDLGSDSLSPFPSPPRGAALKMDGIYGSMRHPMYTGLLMIMAGLSVASDSADRLLLTALLYFSLNIKVDKEEGEWTTMAVTSSLGNILRSASKMRISFTFSEYLMEEYGQEYSEYMSAVPGKFIPADLLDDMPWNQN